MLGIAIAGTVAAPVSTVFAATPIEGDTSSAQTTVTQQTQSNASTANTPTQTAQSSSTAEKAPAAASQSSSTAEKASAAASQASASQTSTAAQPSAPSTSTAEAASQKQVSKGADAAVDHGSSASSQSTPKAATASTPSNTGSTASQGTTGSSTSTASTVSVPKQTADSAKDTSDQYNTSAKTYNDAKQNYETAKNNAQKASDDKDAATKQKEAADKKLADAKKDVSSKTDAVKTAEGNVASANDALSQAKEDVDSAKADVAEKEAAFNDAKAAYDKAKAAADEKDNVLSDAQNKLDALQKGSLLEQAQKALTEAQNEEEKAQSTYDSAKTTADNAKDTLDKAKAAKDSAASQVTDAQKAATDAKAKVTDAQKALDEAQKNWDEAGKRFLEAHVPSDQTFDDYIKAIQKHYSSSDEVEDDYYRNYAADPHFNEALNKALTVENLEKDIDFIEECNKLRAANGLEPLEISYSCMQEAALSAAMDSVASNVYGNYDHFYPDGVMPNSEIWGAYGYGEIASWGYSDPYDGWYTEEQNVQNFQHGMTSISKPSVHEYYKRGDKVLWENDYRYDLPQYPTEKVYTEQECRDFLEKQCGWSDEAINEFFKKYPYGTMTNVQFDNFVNENNLPWGHYGDILTSGFTRTGFGYVDDSQVNYTNSKGYGNVAIQRFVATDSDDKLEADKPETFRQKLEAFVQSAKDKLEQAKQTLADAQAAQTKAAEKLTAAQTASTAANQAYTDAKAKAAAADQAYANASDALAKAKANTADKQKDYDDALAANKDRAEAIKAQQKVVDAAKQDKADAHKALTKAENVKTTADKNLETAKQAQAKADKAYTDANTKVSDTTNALNTAKNALDIAKGKQSTAQSDADTALANETAKINAFKNAQGLEKEAYNAYKKSGDDLVDFVNTHINALPAADSLTLSDRDDVDTMSKIADAVPSELKGSLDSDSLTKLDIAKQKMADLILTQKDKDAAKAAANKVNALPEAITADNASSVYDAQKAYNKLSDRQKDYVGQKVKDKIETAVKEADKAMADKVNEAINNLPDHITLNDKDQVAKVAKMYASLTPEAKQQVDATKLEKAEQAIKDAQAAKNVKDFETMIKALPSKPSNKNAKSVHNLLLMYGQMSDFERAQVKPGLMNKLQRASSMTSEDTTHPKTGDNSMAAAAAAGAAGIAGAAALVLLKKKKDTVK